MNRCARTTFVLALLATVAALDLAAATPLRAQGEASLSATGLVLEETEDGLVLTLQGPVQVRYAGDSLDADSAVVTLGDDLSSLEDALQSVELSGNVRFAGRNGAAGSAGSAMYYARDGRVVLQGSARFSQGGMTASAGSVEYSITGRHLSCSGGCSISQGALSATAESAEYDLAQRTGSLAGSVEVRYRLSKTIFGDETIDEVSMRAGALYISVADGEVKTPEGPSSSRTVMEAGAYTLEADSVIFRIDEAGISDVSAEGRIDLNGPDMRLSADSLALSTSDRVLHAEGDVSFAIRGQEGRAESVEVNFATGWSIRLVGASVEGTVTDEMRGAGEGGTGR